MIKNFEETTRQLAELATVLNSFKSEAVQLRIVDLVFQGVATQAPEPSENISADIDAPVKTRRRRTAVQAGPLDGGAGAKSRRRVSGNGPVPTLELLIQEGFFGKHQTIGQIVEHCRSTKARVIKPSDISGLLGRLVRNNRLKRKKNADGQFEYFA